MPPPDPPPPESPESHPHGGVFISYAHENREEAYEFERRLEALGVGVWIDKEDIPPGAEWPDRIPAAIADASAFLVLWSERAAQSDWVGKEIDCALRVKEARPEFEIVPYCLDKTPLPDSLSRFQAQMPGAAGGRPGIAVFLERWKSKPIARRLTDLDWERPLEDQGGVSLPVLNLVALPLMISVHCHTRLLSLPGVPLSRLREGKPKRLALFLETTRRAGETDNLKLVRDAWRQHHPEEAFFLLQITGPSDADDQLRLDDSGPNGQWLDLVNTAHAAAAHLVGTGAATLQFFGMTLVGVGLAFGVRLERYWDLEIFHYLSREKRYQFVLTTEELGKLH